MKSSYKPNVCWNFITCDLFSGALSENGPDIVIKCMLSDWTISAGIVKINLISWAFSAKFLLSELDLYSLTLN